MNDVLVIVINAFSHRISDGYLADHQTMHKTSATMNAKAIGAYIAENPETQVKVSFA